MKKKILAIAIAMCGLCGLVASAQMPDKSYKPQKFTDFAFEGILLDLDQQAKIDSLNAATFPACPMQQGQQCIEAKPADQDMHCGKHHGMMPGMMPDMRPTPEYVAAVKGILTPEQYVTFLENIVNMPAPQPGAMMAPGHGPKDCQMGQGECKGDCQNCQGCQGHDKKAKGKDKASKDKKDKKK